jgi:CheY-specific phosphatase CheX
MRDDLSLNIVNTSAEPESIDSFKLESYTALINLKSDMCGTIGLSVSTNLAKYMVGQFMFGEVSDEEVEEMAGESVAEILNVVLGNVLKDFPVILDGGKVDISTPYIMHKTSRISKSDGCLMVVNKFDTDHGKLILTFFG